MLAWLLFVAGSLLVAPAHANDEPVVMRSIVAEVVSQRFPTEPLKGPTFKAGEQVEILVEEPTGPSTTSGRARVRAGERYGWVPLDQLGPPNAAAALPIELDPSGLLGGLKPTVPPGAPSATAQ